MFVAKVPSVDDLVLTQTANRLNDAASRNKPEHKFQRSSSVDRSDYNTSQEQIHVGNQVTESRSIAPTRPVIGSTKVTPQTAESTLLLATPVSAPNKSSEASDLVEAEIIDGNTGRKVVMMVSPGQIAQLRAGTVEVSSDAVGDSSEQLLTPMGSIPEKVQEHQIPKVVEPVKPISINTTEKVTQQIRDKLGNVIGVQVMSKTVTKSNTTRPQLVQPKKQAIGQLTIGATPAYEFESESQSSKIQTSVSVQSSNCDQNVVVRRQFSAPQQGGMTEESESDKEPPLYCDGANDEKPKKKKMKLSGPRSVQLRRSTRSTKECEVKFCHVMNTQSAIK